MPRAEVGTPKYVANKMKSKGLQRLRWYCQVCEKQCRDENGFKCHAQSESHLRQMLVVGENAGKHISDYSSEFQGEFVKLLSRRFGTKRVRANQVYQEYISDKNHMHMNSTRWVTLTEFLKHLGRTGVARVDETEKGWYIAWIDNSPNALAKAEASMKKDRMTTSDEQRERQMLAEQIERAQADAPAPSSSSTPPPEEGLKREEGSERVVLSFSSKLSTSEGETSSAPPPTAFKFSNPLKANPLKSSSNPLKPSSNPLKRPPNVFKAAGGASAIDKKRLAGGMSAAEHLMVEEQERKRRKMDREALAT